MKNILSLNDFLNEGVVNKTLYHGTYNENLTSLKPHTNNDKSIPPAIFLSSKKSVARDYGDMVYKCKIKTDNLFETDVKGRSYHDLGSSFDYEINKAFNEEYDGIIFKNIMDSKEPNTKVPLSDVYVIFNSKDVVIVE